MEQPVDIQSLFETHFIALHRYAFTILKDDDEAKDVVQNVFVHLWEKKDSLHINTAPKAYLFRCVYNESINYLRKAEQQQKHLAGAGVAASGEFHDALAAEEESTAWRIRVEAVLDRLPPQCREVFVKSRADRKKYSEIATELGIAVKTVEAHMSKALKLIRQIVRVFTGVFCLLNDFM